MANIVVTTVNEHHIQVDFNDYFPSQYTRESAFYRRSEIAQVEVFEDYILVTMDNKVKWHLSDVQTKGCFVIDEIDGTTSWNDLKEIAQQIALLIKT